MVKLFHSDKDTSSSEKPALSERGIPSPPPLPPRAESRAKPSVLEQQTAESFEQSVPSSEQAAAKSSATMRAIEEILAMPDNSSYKDVASIAGVAKHPFELHQGGVIQSVDELAGACASMSDEVFSHHVTNQRNDFAQWIEHSVGDEVLAVSVRSASSPKQLREVLLGVSDEAVADSVFSKKDDAPKEDESVASEKTGDLAQRFSELHSNVNEEVESSLQLLTDQARRLQALKDEIRSSAESFAHQEQALSDALEQMRSQQKALEADLHAVEEELQRVSSRRSEASNVLSQASKLSEQPSKEPVTTKQVPSSKPAETPSQPVKEAPVEPKASGMVVRSLLAEVRGYVDAGNWSAARKGYQELRDAFYKADDLEGEERKELYNLIHGLYADIHLQSSD